MLTVYSKQLKARCNKCREVGHNSTDPKCLKNKNKRMTNKDSIENERSSWKFLVNVLTVVRYNIRKKTAGNFLEALVELNNYWMRKKVMT